MMQFDKDVANYIAGLADDPFVFCYSTQGVRKVVYWSRASYANCQPHSATVDVLQAALDKTQSAYRFCQVSPHKGKHLVITPMCTAMLDFVLCRPEWVTEVKLGAYKPNPLGVLPKDVKIVEVKNRASGLDDFKVDRTVFDINMGVDLNFCDRSPHGTSTLHRLYMMAAYALVEKRGSEGGYNIGAILATRGGRILAYGLNTAYTNYTYHAEVNLIQSLFANKQMEVRHPMTDQLLGSLVKEVQTGVLYTTLKPCKMCAGMLTFVAPNLKVYYAQNDPGKHARDTTLDSKKKNRQFLLSATGKPIRTYKTEKYDPHTKDKVIQDLGAHLEKSFEAQKKSGPSIVQYLRQTKDLRAAQASLQRKMNKYSAKQEDNSGNLVRYNREVETVLRHIQNFLRSRGVHDFQQKIVLNKELDELK